MTREITGRINARIMCKSKEIGIELAMPTMVKINRTTLGDNAIPDCIGVLVGKGQSDSLESYIENDNSRTILSKCIENDLVITEYYTQRIGQDLIDIPHYFVPYDIEESSANRTTFLASSCGYGTPITGRYKCEYEILLSTGDLTRRMLFTNESVNISMYEWIQDLEDMLENLDKAAPEIKEQFFKEDGIWMFSMFSPIGTCFAGEVDRSEFLSMIVSIRQLSCEFIDDDASNV